MKKNININGREFLYEVDSMDCGEYGASNCYTTYFYIPNGVGTYKKYWLFGPEITYSKYKNVFEVHADIESPNLSKKDVNDLIQPALKRYDREIEIEKGEII